MKHEKLKELLETDLQYLYDSEKQMVRALVKLSKIATYPDLRKATKELLEVTKSHIQDIESIFEDLQFNCQAKKSKGMEGILQEAQEIGTKLERQEPNMIDAALIATIQRALHYNIATYKLLRNYAKLIGNQYVAELLNSSLQDDIRIDRKLLRIATSRVNPYLK